MYDLDQNSELRAGGGLEDFGTIDTRKVLNIIALVVSLGVVIYGSIKFGWDMPEMAAMFIWLAIVVGIHFRISIRIPFARTSWKAARR